MGVQNNSGALNGQGIGWEDRAKDLQKNRSLFVFSMHEDDYLRLRKTFDLVSHHLLFQGSNF